MKITNAPAFVIAALFSIAVPAMAQVAPLLGTAGNFSVLGATPNVTNTGATTVTGDVGVSPAASVTGFPPGIVVGTIHLGDSAAAQAQIDLTAAYNTAASQVSNPCPAGNNLTGQVLGSGGTVPTLVPGVYCFNSTAQLTGNLTLNGAGVYIFQVGSGLTTASASAITPINGATACNVFFQVTSSAVIGTTTQFAGNILALSSITVNTGARVTGRLLARTGTVTLDSNTVGGCAAGVVPPTVIGVNCPSGLLTLGANGVATITLSAPAPAGGTTVLLSSSAPGTASVPVSVFVPAGAISVSFTVTPGATPGNATITATTGGVPASCSLVVGLAPFAGAVTGATLDPIGMTILLVLLAAAGIFAANRFGS